MPTPAENPTDITNAQDQVAQSLGYKSYQDALSALTAAPTQSETDLYNAAYSSAGLDTLANKITSRQNDLATATANINDNPWLDEADRVGRNKTLTDLANADIKNRQDQYNAGLKSVQDLVTRETADQAATTKANAANSPPLKQTPKRLPHRTRLQRRQPQRLRSHKKNTTGATYKWNSNTQTFDEILPAAPKTSTTTGAKASGTATSRAAPAPSSRIWYFTATQLGKLNSMGLSQSDANGILQDIKAGQTSTTSVSK